MRNAKGNLAMKLAEWEIGKKTTVTILRSRWIFKEEVRDIWSELREEVLGSEQWSVELLDSLLRKLPLSKEHRGK